MTVSESCQSAAPTKHTHSQCYTVNTALVKSKVPRFVFNENRRDYFTFLLYVKMEKTVITIKNLSLFQL